MLSWLPAIPLSLPNPTRSSNSRIPACISSVLGLLWFPSPNRAGIVLDGFFPTVLIKILWSFVSGSTESGPALPLIRQSRELPHGQTQIYGDWMIPKKTNQQNISLLLLPRPNPAWIRGGLNPPGASAVPPAASWFFTHGNFCSFRGVPALLLCPPAPADFPRCPYPGRESRIPGIERLCP